ncbi:MAG: four-carbon acid sugar kinase family protein [Proteobacteria bacterium]|nr:four-carbon acid sugar kinase family protein [Pseudomonadota bacterium]
MRPLYGYYGDDFTGSTDVLEALALAGIRTVLFIGLPAEERWGEFGDCQAFGIAGESRSRASDWMSQHLPAVFRRLGALRCPVIHYKTCSTFDSSPQIGSIGRALEIGRETLSPPFIPIVVAAPHLRRYLAFGHLFAAAGETIHRIDRHPTMRAHPVTPMYEADLRRHLAAQTALGIGLVDLTDFARGRAREALSDCLSRGDAAVLFDGVSEAELRETGRILWECAERGTDAEPPLFCAGSSGLTYALLSAWRRAGLIAGEPAASQADSVETLLVLSGSCSPVTERQIRKALANGYQGVALNVTQLLDENGGAAAAENAVAEAVGHLRAGRSTILYSALGPLAPAAHPCGEALGRRAGALLRRILRQAPVPRVVLAGGDTSTHAVMQLGAHALTWEASLEPGAPLCRAHAQAAKIDGLQLVLKGGQVGGDDFFERVRLWR